MQRSETIFCVGSSGSGKTILLKKLEQKEEQDWHDLVSSTIPTVGINHFEIDASKCGDTNKEWDLMKFIPIMCKMSHRNTTNGTLWIFIKSFILC